MNLKDGKKLLFMGSEFGQWREWNHDRSLDWHLLEHGLHQGVSLWLRDLNRLYRNEPALYERDFTPDGFSWVDCHDWEQSSLSYLRHGNNPDDTLLVVCNFTPVTRTNQRVGVPRPGYWRELLNSDAQLYGGSGQGNLGGVESTPVAAHGHYHSLLLTLPPLSVLIFRQDSGVSPERILKSETLG